MENLNTLSVKPYPFAAFIFIAVDFHAIVKHPLFQWWSFIKLYSFHSIFHTFLQTIVLFKTTIFQCIMFSGFSNVMAVVVVIIFVVVATIGLYQMVVNIQLQFLHILHFILRFVFIYSIYFFCLNLNLYLNILFLMFI